MVLTWGRVSEHESHLSLPEKIWNRDRMSSAGSANRICSSNDAPICYMPRPKQRFIVLLEAPQIAGTPIINTYT